MTSSMFTTAEEAHQATLRAWETILREHGMWDKVGTTVKRFLNAMYLPETDVPDITNYQGRTLRRTRRGRITLLRAPHNKARPKQPEPLQQQPKPLQPGLW